MARRLIPRAWVGLLPLLACVGQVGEQISIADIDAGQTSSADAAFDMSDAGPINLDSGQPEVGVDAATNAPDAGTPDTGISDAGTPDAGTPDAGTPDAGTPDAGTPDAGTPGADGGGTGVEPLSVFIAQGHLGRTTVSCDLGRTWVANRDDVNPSDRCWQPPPDSSGTEYECDHHTGAARGLVWGDGWWVANFGWGPIGTVRRSRTGVSWEIVDAGFNAASMVWADGLFVGASNEPKQSANLGRTWSAAGEIPNLWTTIGNVRRGAAGSFGGSTLWLLSGDNGIALGRMTTNGMSWTLPTVPSNCRAGQYEGGAVVTASRIVLVNSNGTVCSTTDGVAFTTRELGTSVSGRLLYVGSTFMIWGGDSVYRSANALNWQATRTTLTSGSGTPSIGAVAWGEGVFVASGGYGDWYGTQRFYRSTDGVAWQQLASTSFRGSHPILNIAFGRALPSSACPSP